MKNRVTAILLAVLLVLTLAVGGVQAQTVSPMTSNNQYSHDYLLYRNYYRPWNWADTILSYLVAHDDGSYTRVEASDDYNTDAPDRVVTVETYSSSFGLTSQKQFAFELPLFGGFYEGSRYYFLVFGQENHAEDDTAEVVRVVRYTKDWQRVDAASVCGANTTIPFDAGSLRMVEVDGMLYIHTCHEMYTSADGLNHQANMTYAVRISDMTVTYSQYNVWNIGIGYVSHSFNQFIAADGEDLVTVDHGDAYLRSVILCRYPGMAGEETRTNRVSYVEVLPIMDSDTVGYNYTGVQVGALQVSDTHYLVAGTTVSQDDSYDPTERQNVFITATPKNDFTEEATTLTFFTDEAPDSAVQISNPYLVEISKTKYLLMWNMDDTLHYQFVDGTGAPISEVKTMNAQLSDCVPVLTGEQVVWYTTNQSAPMFFAIDLSGKAHTHSYTSVVTAPGCYTQGYTTHVCTCGERYVDTYVDATGHDWGEYYEAVAPGCETSGQMRAPCRNAGCWYYTYYYTDALGHDYVGGVCTRCGEADPNYVREQFNIYTVSMTLGSDLTMYFWVPAANVVEGDYLQVTKAYADGRADVVKKIPIIGCEVNDGYYKVPFTGIAAKEMNDTMTAVVCDANDNAVTGTRQITVKKYAQVVYRQDTDAALRTVLVDMLNYGAAAQTQFTYDTENLVNADLTEEQAAYATATLDTTRLATHARRGEICHTFTLSLKSSIELDVYYPAAKVPEGAVLKVSYTNYNGNAKSLEIPASAFVSDGDYVYAIVNTMSAADINTVVTLELYDGSVCIDHTELNVATYCKISSSTPVVAAMAKYCLSAYDYFT